jgi:pimeloyl-ACP methyl ester carboxylesterase
MSDARVGGVRLYYESAGRGSRTLVLVHGSWSSHRNWHAVVPALAESFRVVAYDRRGHSLSERPSTQGSVLEDVDDLAGLIEQLDLAPAFVAGSSFGATIALRFAGARPDLVRAVIAHEPPLFPWLARDPETTHVAEDVRRRVGAVVERIATGDHAGAAEQFVETVALGAGSWARLPAEVRHVMIANAPTFLDESNDPDALNLDRRAMQRLDRPVLLSKGQHSPPPFARIMGMLAGTLPRAEVLTYEGAGHIPQVTHPQAYVDAVVAFCRRHDTRDGNEPLS